MKNDKIDEENIDACLDQVEKILNHIKNVQHNGIFLGKKLIKRGDVEFGKALIAKIMMHDNSKFKGIEFDYLDPETKNKELLNAAIATHHAHNDHHPEHFPEGIHGMNSLQLSELACDWTARGREFGKDIKEWVKGTACERFGFTLNQKVGKEIMEYINLLVDQKL